MDKELNNLRYALYNQREAVLPVVHRHPQLLLELPDCGQPRGGILLHLTRTGLRQVALGQLPVPATKTALSTG